MSILQYNNVVLPYALASDFRQEAVYDESETDRYLTRFSITVQSIINLEYIALLLPGFENILGEPADIMKMVRGRLLQARKTLSYKINDTELLPARQIIAPGGRDTIQGTVDAKNGPLPQQCSIVALTNTSFLITYSIIAHYWENNRADSDSNPRIRNDTGSHMLYNRWSESVEIDECDYSTRTREGKFVIRSDNVEGVLADQLRSQMAVLSVPRGFTRTHRRYSISADGLTLNYTVTDKEAYVLPPSPAYTARGRYTETAAQFGGVVYGDVNVTLRGRKDTDRSALLGAALGVCVQKLRLRQRQLNPAKPFGYIVQNAAVSQDLYDNEVNAAIRVMYQRASKRVFRVGGFVKLDLSTPISDGKSPTYNDRGTASLLIQAARYYDPDAFTTQLGTGSATIPDNPATTVGDRRYQLDSGREPGRAGRVPEE